MYLGKSADKSLTLRRLRWRLETAQLLGCCGRESEESQGDPPPHLGTKGPSHIFGLFLLKTLQESQKLSRAPVTASPPFVTSSEKVQYYRSLKWDIFKTVHMPGIWLEVGKPTSK